MAGLRRSRSNLRRIEPVITTAAHITARLEETRLLVTHAITLTVEKAGIYSLELAPLGSFLVADVRGEGIEDWKGRGRQAHHQFLRPRP